ncbi:uncharacterized protein LOC119987862 [Tripterygium wilfordii]|nr:uncharacterized protein LOC119987862 [Tripterygium wilfordii]
MSYTWMGGFLHLFSVSSIVSTSIAFLVIDKNDDDYPSIDIYITYILLVGALALETYEILVMLLSDQTLIWLSMHKNSCVDFAYKIINHLQYVLRWSSLINSDKRWSSTMRNYNLISICLKPTMKSTQIQKHSCNDFHIVSADLKRLIFEQLMQKSMHALNVRASKQLCAQRGDQVLKDMGCFDDIGWSVEMGFDQSILLWHIATDMCYSIDQYKDAHMTENQYGKCGKSLAGYMLHLVMHPSILPSASRMIRSHIQDTCADAMRFFRERSISNTRDACDALFQMDTGVPQSVGDRSMSILFEACTIAKYIQSLETEKHWTNERKWEMVSHVWVEMLSYAASQCQWRNHAKLLTSGGELLTHVWLLMAHLGITEQLHISQGDVMQVKILNTRANLV